GCARPAFALRARACLGRTRTCSRREHSESRQELEPAGRTRTCDPRLRRQIASFVDFRAMTTNIIIKQFVERYRSELRSGAFAYYKTIYNISLNDEARGRDYGVTNCLSDF